ncbi:transcriptional regulator, CopG family [Pyrobaculum islandicum DSM 4184]|uniref:Transcriptional regulator, CopG family n=1 Tax=Pyrobaculum islandicum (strain DSM 4184 / JCM 9189 / GEO3) TaxID=384616 RepID=A1RUR0_PYRIL|nr:hypothetical protein [Pyrobaculum islandicum]ABL88692.1 transcriptional regulator, CopG family [Pyrobaculum islandicum DSM 4184]
MAVVSFEVGRELKEKMEKYKDKVNWGEELRKFVEEKIRELEAEENMEKVVKELESLDVEVPAGFSQTSIREDRDRD